MGRGVGNGAKKKYQVTSHIGVPSYLLDFFFLRSRDLVEGSDQGETPSTRVLYASHVFTTNAMIF